MESVLLLLTIVALSLLVTRVATAALTLTGLSRQLAQFQARSALTGVGFTTSEAENVVHHPVRRRIIMMLMIVGNAGVVTAMASLILAFVNPADTGEWITRIVLLVGGVGAIWGLATSRWVNRRLSWLIEAALRRWTDLDVRDYATILRLVGAYAISEFQVEAGDWLAERSLAELELGAEGILVLGIQRADGHYVGTPTGRTTLRPDDTLILYGREPRLAELDSRPAGPEGDAAHRRAVAAQHHEMEPS